MNLKKYFSEEPFGAKKEMADYLGITPTSVEAVVPSYLWRFHPKGEYAGAQKQARLLSQ